MGQRERVGGQFFSFKVSKQVEIIIKRDSSLNLRICCLLNSHVLNFSILSTLLELVYIALCSYFNCSPSHKLDGEIDLLKLVEVHVN